MAAASFLLLFVSAANGHGHGGGGGGDHERCIGFRRHDATTGERLLGTPSCSCSIENCHDCDHPGSPYETCNICKNKWNLYGGRCHLECDAQAGFRAVGTGNFRRVCARSSSPAAAAPHFDGEAHQMFSTEHRLASSEIALSFRTTAARGILFYNGEPEIDPGMIEAVFEGGEDYIGLGLRKGQLCLAFDTGAGPKSLCTSRCKKFNDGYWHSVLATRTGSSGARIRVDGEVVAEVEDNGLGDRELDSGAAVFVGGIPEDFNNALGEAVGLASHEGFVGDISGVSFDGRELYSARAVDDGTRGHLADMSLCESVGHPCRNNGVPTCFQHADLSVSFSCDCECHSDHTGDHCHCPDVSPQFAHGAQYFGMVKDAPPFPPATMADAPLYDPRIPCSPGTTSCANGVSLECGLGTYLFDGRCVGSCPEGFLGRGQGDFGRRCIVAPSDPNCHEADTSTGRCTMCKNEHYLDAAGACVMACPEGTVGFGTGTFKRRCCDRNCHTCNIDGSCAVCKNRRFELGGTCADSCPANHWSSGTGNFFRRCLEKTCANDRHCHMCGDDAAAGTCQICKNRRYLYNGACVDECPATLSGVGTGNFHRVCGPKKAAPLKNCHTPDAADASRCEICKNKAYLSPTGKCVATCPVGSAPRGTGNFYRKCEVGGTVAAAAPATSGSDGTKNCVARYIKGSECTVCKNKFYLFEGRCLRECPDGHAGQGSGNFYRVCKALDCSSDPNCGACGPDGRSCAICENGRKLHAGTCVAACPFGFEEKGTVAKRCEESEEDSRKRREAGKPSTYEIVEAFFKFS